MVTGSSSNSPEELPCFVCFLFKLNFTFSTYVQMFRHFGRGIEKTDCVRLVNEGRKIGIVEPKRLGVFGLSRYQLCSF